MGVRLIASQVPVRPAPRWSDHAGGPEVLVRALPDAVTAERLAATVLAGDPGRLRHVRSAAAVALLVSEAVAPARVDLLLSAAVLHDIGYADGVRDTGFHPLDGADWLAARGAPAELTALVAHHSESAMLPAAQRWVERFRRHGRPDPVVADVVTYADQTAAPDGRRVSPIDRIAERRRRRPPGDAAAAAVERRRTERLVHAVARVHVRLELAGAQDAYLAAVDGIGTTVLRSAAADREVAARVGAALPGLCALDALGPCDRVRAAVAAARMLAVLGPDPYYVDPTVTACRLLTAERGAADLSAVR